MKSDAYYLAELEDKIIETVSNYMENIPRPFGLLLSGGFDSGLLAALTKPDKVYTVRFPYGIKYDESRYAEAIVEHLHLGDKVRMLIPDKESFQENFKDAVRIMGEPTTHFSLVPFYMIMKLIRSNWNYSTNLNILSGEGPDEYLGGYARQIVFDELQKMYEIPELRNYQDTIKKVLNDEFEKGHETMFLIRRYGQMMGYSTVDVDRYMFLHKDYPLQGAIGKMDMELGTIEKMEQKLAKANGVHLHYPYINDIFAEYCYHLPDHLKIRNGVTKWAFRQICRKYLPEFIMDRSKMGGPVAPVNYWIGGQAGEFNKDKYINLQKEILNG